MTKGMGNFFLGEVGVGNVKWTIYEEIALLQYCNIAILQYCNKVFFNKVNI